MKKSLALLMLCLLVSLESRYAVENLPPGTKLKTPSGDIFQIDESSWIYSRGEHEAAILDRVTSGVCQGLLAECESKLMPKLPSFFATRIGKTILVVGAAVALGAAFELGRSTD